MKSYRNHTKIQVFGPDTHCTVRNVSFKSATIPNAEIHKNTSEHKILMTCHCFLFFLSMFSLYCKSSCMTHIKKTELNGNTQFPTEKHRQIAVQELWI